MLIIGIESSCDETAIAVLRDGRQVLASKISSQIARHAPFGGVVPEIAAREHLNSIQPLFDAAMKEAVTPEAAAQDVRTGNSGITLSDIDAVAVTQGPGLVGALLVGVSCAKGLALANNKPLIPVDHVHAHIHGALLGLSDKVAEAALPCLALVVSGGHTNLYLVENPLDFKLIAHTVDDACGECLDKVGKLLGLPYPGGPWIERNAAKGNPDKIAMPRTVEKKSQMEFSYSGLKTHMAQMISRLPQPIPEDQVADMCAAFQREAFQQLIRKLEIARGKFPHVRSIVVAGGVAANKAFRSMAERAFKIPCHFPEPEYCSDNAAMIAALGWHMLNDRGPDAFKATDWDVYPRYPFENYKFDSTGANS